MEQAVKAAQVNEGAKACEALHHALYAVADLCLGEELVASSVHLFLKVAAAVHHHVGLVVGIEALYIKFALCSKQAFGLFNLLAVRLADGKESVNVAAESDFKSALDNLLDRSVNRGLFVKRLANVFPHLLGVCLGFRNFRTVSSVFSDENNCYKIPCFGQVARKFRYRNLSFRLVSNVDEDILVCYSDNRSVNKLAVFKRLKSVERLL